ncbi:hypothetical protein GUJ93_ZPchr0008g13013, partial [Zizania palustris]
MVVSSRYMPQVPELDGAEDMQPHSPAGVPASPPQSVGQGSAGPEPDLHELDLDDHLDADHDDAPLRLRSMDSIIGQADLPGQAVRNVEGGQLHIVSAEEPTSLEEAMHEPH